MGCISNLVTNSGGAFLIDHDCLTRLLLQFICQCFPERAGGGRVHNGNVSRHANLTIL